MKSQFESSTHMSVWLMRSTGCLPQSRQRRLVIEDCLVKRAALLDERCLRVGDFNYLRFAGAITRDRCSNIVLRFRDAFTRQLDARRRTLDLRPRGIKLLRESAQRHCSFVLRHLRRANVPAARGCGLRPNRRSESTN